MAANTQTRAVRSSVQGRVQGVSYRASLCGQARQLGLTGWVRNEPDGTVAFLAQGDAAAVQRLLDWARRGPPGARVDGLDAHDCASNDALTRFEVRR